MSDATLPQGLSGVMQGVIDVDGYVLFAALLGALLVFAARDRLAGRASRRPKVGRSLLLVFVTVGVGHLFEPLVLSLAPMLSRGMAAFVAAVVVIPVSLKVMDWLESLDPQDIIQRWRRKG
ncbi:hypothetical protein KSS93_20145 [Pseudomonas xanthosomatis]|uniref:hypothetical protein n=1 Tax=Pseudomonas xanthosomatis TaxID=2842356 RepID=UPI001C3E34E5|nr:hypothetical protein [Pseudomonas xanthosomatis]QXH45171.1 hypothetical protein KSS93_20145 [Pseudomonas xanthosomatis]